ncbi:MAG: tRNA-dihydrouridine synthase family protein [Flavobacteriales bacterium]
MVTLLSSPLQGFTDYRFRNAFHHYFGGIDTFYAPYIRLDGKLKIKPNYDNDIQPKNNSTLKVIPQIMTNDADEFLFVVEFIQKLGYNELNWNLGCPYPMVVNRCMGSGLISEPERIKSILRRVHDHSNVTVSMKMRMGYEHAEEILEVLPILDTFPLKNIAIHARIGKQLYKGGTDLEAFQRCLDSTKHHLYYNGDITSVEAFLALQRRFPSITHWMIGRGLISDPFLPGMIKSNSADYPENAQELFSKFHDTLLDELTQKLKGEKHVIQKMASYWEYFQEGLFSDYVREIKKVRKAKSLSDYEGYAQAIISSL